MNLKRILAIGGLLVAGLCIAYGISLLNPTPVKEGFMEADQELRARVETAYGFEPGQYGIYLREQEGAYYLLEIYADRVEGGGGGWSIAHDKGDHLEEVEGGQHCVPTCAALTAHAVPTSFMRYCQAEGADFFTVTDRVTGEIVEGSSDLCI